MLNIGIYSGSFDPIHLGHVDFVDAATKQLNLDIIYVLAEPTPWKKTNILNIQYRQKMLDLQFESNNRVITRLDGLSNSHDTKSTLRTLDSAYDIQQAKFYLLMGVDIFLNVNNWDGFDKLVERFEFAVALRTEDDGEELVFKMLDLPEAKVTKFSTNKSTINSSGIRSAIAQGQAPSGLSGKVAEYIKDNNFYVS